MLTILQDVQASLDPELVSSPLPPSRPIDAGPPAYTLFDARTVADVWREWREGIAGGPALQVLEET